MPVNVRDLKPGDRVMLNCPKARYKARREAEFVGTYTGVELRERVAGGRGMVVIGGLDSNARYATFLLSVQEPGQTHYLRDERGDLLPITAPPDSPLRHLCGMRIADDVLKDEEGRTVFIEQRLGRASFG